MPPSSQAPQQPGSSSTHRQDKLPEAQQAPKPANPDPTQSHKSDSSLKMQKANEPIVIKNEPADEGYEGGLPLPVQIVIQDEPVAKPIVIKNEPADEGYEGGLPLPVQIVVQDEPMDADEAVGQDVSVYQGGSNGSGQAVSAHQSSSGSQAKNLTVEGELEQIMN